MKRKDANSVCAQIQIHVVSLRIVKFITKMIEVEV